MSHSQGKISASCLLLVTSLHWSRSRIFLKRGCTTKKQLQTHLMFCIWGFFFTPIILLILVSNRSSQGEVGPHPLHPSPRFVHAAYYKSFKACLEKKFMFRVYFHQIFVHDHCIALSPVRRRMLEPLNSCLAWSCIRFPSIVQWLEWLVTFTCYYARFNNWIIIALTTG